MELYPPWRTGRLLQPGARGSSVKLPMGPWRRNEERVLLRLASNLHSIDRGRMDGSTKFVRPPDSPPLNYLPIRMKPWIACVPKCEVGGPLKVKVTLDSGRTAPPTTSIDSLHGVASEHLDIKGAALPSAVT